MLLRTRKILISILFLTTFISCEKRELGNLQYVETTPGGCALDLGSSLKNSQITQPDTVTYSVTNDSLNIFVGFNATCCTKFSTSSSIKGDSLLIKIRTTRIGSCNCICYYTYNFNYSGSGYYYDYHVSIDKSKNFYAQIKP
jgi:hypothetical protein